MNEVLICRSLILEPGLFWFVDLGLPSKNFRVTGRQCFCQLNFHDGPLIPFCFDTHVLLS